MSRISSLVFPILICVLLPFHIHEIVNALLCALLKCSLASALFLGVSHSSLHDVGERAIALEKALVTISCERKTKF